MERMKTTNLSVAVMAMILLAAQAVMAGTITGNVKVAATKMPAVKPLKMDADPECVEKHGSPPAHSQSFIVDADKNLKHVFVYVKSGLDPAAKFRAPKAPVVLDQKGCVYVPHVFGLVLGQPLKVLNSDDLLHNVHLIPKNNREVNKAMPAFRKQLTFPPKLFARPEVMIPITCDAHPWMASYAGVLPHPFFAVTAADGSYEIKDVPPGKYEVEAWHEFFDNLTQEVDVGAEAVTLSFALTPPSK